MGLHRLAAAAPGRVCGRSRLLRALPGRLRIIQATLDDVCGLLSGARDAVRPAQLADRLIALTIIDQMRDIDLHYWTPVMG